MAKCKHESSSFSWSPERPDGTQEATARFCDDCGGRLGLGPSNDTPAVKVEIRAAKLADGVAVFRSLERYGWNGFGGSVSNYCLPLGQRFFDAGWLAHAIVVHHQLLEAEEHAETGGAA